MSMHLLFNYCSFLYRVFKICSLVSYFFTNFEVFQDIWFDDSLCNTFWVGFWFVVFSIEFKDNLLVFKIFAVDFCQTCSQYQFFGWFFDGCWFKSHQMIYNNLIFSIWSFITNFNGMCAHFKVFVYCNCNNSVFTCFKTFLFIVNNDGYLCPSVSGFPSSPMIRTL